MKKVLPIILIGLAITLSGCTLPWQKPATNNPSACTQEAKLCPDGSAVGRQGPNCEFAECPAQIANPASVNCKAKGGTSEIITANDGSQSGICKFPDGTQCEEWAFFRGECPKKECVPEGGLTSQNVYSSTPVEKRIKCCAGLIPQARPGAPADSEEICVKP